MLLKVLWKMFIIKIDNVAWGGLYLNIPSLEWFLKCRKGYTRLMEERRKIGRVDFKSKGFVVMCETGDKFEVDTCNVSPLGMAVLMPAGTPSLSGKDVIVVAETIIMYADVIRETELEDGRLELGLSAKRFSPDVMEYLFENIGGEGIIK